VRTASLTVTDNAGTVAGSTQTATLSGTGVTSVSVAIVSLTPASGTGTAGTAQAFTGVYSDSSGATSYHQVTMLFNTAASVANGCYVTYQPGTNGLYLYNNAGTAATGPIAPGSSSTLSNSQCTLSGTGSSVTASGNDLSVTYNLTFSGSFTGAKNVYMSGTDASGTNTGGVLEGSWTP